MLPNHITADMNGLATFGDYNTPTTAADKVQALIDLIAPEQTNEHRGYLDQISPAAHRQLLVELTALKAEAAEVDTAFADYVTAHP